MEVREINKFSTTEFKGGKTYLMVINRNADIDGKALLKDFKRLHLDVIIVFSNYVDGIKFL